MDSLIGWPLVLLSASVYFAGKKIHRRYFPLNILPKRFGVDGLRKGLKIEVRHSRLTSIQLATDTSNTASQVHDSESSFFFASGDAVPMVSDLSYHDSRELADQWSDHRQKNWIYNICMEKMIASKVGLQSISPQKSSFDANLKLTRKLKRKELPRILDLGTNEMSLSVSHPNGSGSESDSMWPQNSILFMITENGVCPAILLYPNHQEIPMQPLGLKHTPFFEQYLKSCTEACQLDALYVENTPELWTQVIGVVQVCSKSPGIHTISKIAAPSSEEPSGSPKSTVWESSAYQIQQFRRIVLDKVLNRFSASI